MYNLINKMKILAENRRALFDYEILEKIQAGLGLFGFEVKAVKTGRINLAGSYVIFRQNEAWLINADIPPYQAANQIRNYDPRRNRRLLLKKSEIKNLSDQLREKKAKLIPLRLYLKGNLIKIELGLGRHRKTVDKRELLKKRTLEREVRRRE